MCRGRGKREKGLLWRCARWSWLLSALFRYTLRYGIEGDGRHARERDIVDPALVVRGSVRGHTTTAHASASWGQGDCLAVKGFCRIGHLGNDIDWTTHVTNHRDCNGVTIRIGIRERSTVCTELDRANFGVCVCHIACATLRFWLGTKWNYLYKSWGQFRASVRGWPAYRLLQNTNIE